MGADPDEFENDKNDPDNKKAEHEGWTTLQEKKRSCTDCLCVGVIIMTWVIMTIVGFIACGIFESEDLPPGNPARLINPMDSHGRICGFSKDVKDKEFGYFFPDTSIVCVSKCPSATDYNKFICQNIM